MFRDRSEYCEPPPNVKAREGKHTLPIFQNVALKPLPYKALYGTNSYEFV